jgi:hypothetical protein
MLRKEWLETMFAEPLAARFDRLVSRAQRKADREEHDDDG